MAEPGQPAGSLELLGTAGCHLCEQADPLARSAAAYLSLSIVVVDVALEGQLADRYGSRIPVLRYRASNGVTRDLDWPFGLLDVLRLVRPAGS